MDYQEGFGNKGDEQPTGDEASAAISPLEENSFFPEATKNNVEEAVAETSSLIDATVAPLPAAVADPVVVESETVSKATAQERQDAVAKQRARGTSQMSSPPGAVSGTNEPPRDPLLPGAVAVTPSSPPPEPPILASTTSMSSQESQDAMAKQRARGMSRRTNSNSRSGAEPVGSSEPAAPVIMPGAVAVTPMKLEEPATTTVTLEPEESSAASAATTNAMSQERQDALAKQRATRGRSRMSNNSNSNISDRSVGGGGVVPGAVAVQPSSPPPAESAVLSPSSSTLSQEEDNVDNNRFSQGSPPSPRRQAASQAEQDAIAKSRARRGAPSNNYSSVTGGSSMISSGIASMSETPRTANMGEETDADGVVGGGLDELARRREERAAARSHRRGTAASVGAQSIVSTTDSSSSSTAEARKMARETASSSVVGSSARRTSDNSTTPTNSSSSNVAPPFLTSSASVFSTMSEPDRQRRYDAKMAQMGQLHEDSLEKRSTSGAGDSGSDTIRTNTNSWNGATPNIPEVERQGYDPEAGENMDPRQLLYEDKLAVDAANNYHSTGETSRASVYLAMLQGAALPEKSDEFRTTEQVLDIEKFGDHQHQPGQASVTAVAEDTDLAVAIAIDEEEDGLQGKDYAYAVEYDPDSKPPLYQNRRFRLYGIGGAICFVILAIVLIVVVVTSKKGGEALLLTLEPTSAPTMAPTTARENQYRSFLSQRVSPNVSEPGTPHYSAAQWIMYDDPLQLDPQDPDLLQRYMMAFLYFHTTDNGADEWRSCNPPKEGEDETCEYMEFSRLANDTIYYVPRSGRYRWLSAQDECEWVGVECAGGTTILGFRLFGQNLTGTLPTELAALPFLQRISVAYNELEGTLPAEWASLKYLIDIEVHGNQLTGTIPAEYFDTETMGLVNFNIGDNLFSGTLDTRIGLMRDLKGLHIFENNFEGTFPTEIENLDYLSFSRANGNQFDGPLPTQLARLGQLSELWYHENLFSGPIPSELGRLYRLQDFRIWGNRFTGTIPDELFNMTKLWRFSVREMALTGTLSTLVGQLTNLKLLKVSTNQLTGTIPSEIQNIPTLIVAWLHYNQFTGPVPDAICSLVRPGGLEFLQADCNPVDNPPNPCRCCSACCDRELQTCLSNELL